MAHQIETHNGKAAFVTANIPAWHQLGTVLDGAFTAEQAMELGRLGGHDVSRTSLSNYRAIAHHHQVGGVTERHVEIVQHRHQRVSVLVECSA